MCELVTRQLVEPPGPVLLERAVTGASDDGGDGVPGWVKSAAKLLNSGADNQDWSTLARILGTRMTSSLRVHGTQQQHLQ